MAQDLISALNAHFELVHANTDALRMEVYRLRYQVYVLETGFERPDECRNGVDADGNAIQWEEDEFDSRSDHYLLRHRRTGVNAATTRLILPDALDPMAPYPMEVHCPLDRSVTDSNTRRHLAEISRFAVSKQFKRRLGEQRTLAGVSSNIEIYFEDDERRVLPHISLGLFAAVMRMVHNHGLTHLYAVMEPALIRLLARFGVYFTRIGPDVDYHGLRVPCLMTREDSLQQIQRDCPQVWDLITNHGQLADR